MIYVDKNPYINTTSRAITFGTAEMINKAAIMR